MSKNINIFKNLALVSQIGISMIIPIIFGVYVGKWMDEKLGTGPIFLFIFIIIGIASSFVSIFKLVESEFGQDKRK
ncbi:AtpZ/AtpI family protein [Alkaliphilus oremlandii]|uniref:F0F1-ATPase subunit n=1 Tax=Alkaliphilus oremlandii (strain OhILAs) TaxID=350688 RepID=A8MJW7_ALKOO|nr:AtpZ/AtpI family protein [Alkaliphilus oremlandii]ABW20099.1 conserved hypothetical protein [Alkaliphilus oremlandii OhILAs]